MAGFYSSHGVKHGEATKRCQRLQPHCLLPSANILNQNFLGKFEGYWDLTKFKLSHVGNKRPHHSSGSGFDEKAAHIRCIGSIFLPVVYWDKPLIMLGPSVFVLHFKVENFSTNAFEFTIAIEILLNFRLSPLFFVSFFRS